jgi:hypothetical protein
MRIVYLHQYFNTPDMPGATRSYELARRLVQKGHRVDMITSDRSDGALGARPLQQRNVISGTIDVLFPIRIACGEEGKLD